MSAQQHEKFLVRVKRNIGQALMRRGSSMLASLPRPKFPASDWQRRPPIPSVSEIQEAAHRAFEKCSTHPRPGEFVQAFNRVKQASAPMAQLPPPRANTDAFAPVSRPLSVDFMPTMRADTPREGLEKIPAVRVPDEAIRTLVQHIQRGRVANIPTTHNEVIPQDHFLVVGPDALFEPMDKVPTSRPLTDSERASMRDATDSMFEMPAQPGTNTWEEFEALASKSGLLPIVETEFPTVETPAIVAKRQAERAAARRERYQLPDLEQRESE